MKPSTLKFSLEDVIDAFSYGVWVGELNPVLSDEDKQTLARLLKRSEQIVRKLEALDSKTP